MSLSSVGLSGLNSAQSGLSATAHNIANVNTPGYSRQLSLQTSNTPQFTGGGYVGQGSNVSTILRSYSGFLDMQAREAQTQSSQAGDLSARLSNVDQMFSDASAGLSPALDDFFKGISTVASNPADVASRQTMVSGGATLANRLNDLAARLESQRADVNEQVKLSVGGINAASDQIADLNKRIVLASGIGNGPPNDLLDQRDALLRDMAKQVRITTTPLPSGAINVVMSNGQPVVLDGQSFKITAAADPTDNANTAVGIQAGNTFTAFDDSTLTGGALGGALAFRTQTLDAAENALGRLAGALGTAMNAQHAAGQDRNGNLGGALFAFNGARAMAATYNTGTGVVTATVANYNAVTTSDYRIDYNGTNYLVTRLSDNNTQSFGSLPQTVDGVSIALASGTPAAGDSFKVQPTRVTAAGFTSLISDPNLIAAALPVRAAIAGANTGAGALRVTGVTPPPGANLTQPVTITFTGANTFDVSGTGTGNPTGLAYTPGMTLSYNGWSATLSGTVKAGDVFTVGPNTNGNGDNGNMLALSAINTTQILGGGTMSVGEAYATAVSDIGNQASAAAAGAKAQDAVLTQATTAQQSLTGVNLDEEAANLLKYQQAYQAASRVISTANSLFQDIIGIMR
jgi:flagellar hook-associated protein 1 FlgK